MKTAINFPDDLRGVFAVPSLCRTDNQSRTIDFEENRLLVEHIRNGGIIRFIYGGNAFLYHITLDDYALLLDWLPGLSNDLWVIPSLGPGFGRALDQAPFIRSSKFPCAMALPCHDPRDAQGLEDGYREIAEAAATRLLLYLKDETSFGSDKERGLDVIGRLVDEGVCIGIKYAVVREEPAADHYLDGLLKRVDRSFVISGIGERPAVTHLREWRLPGFTTGSGCVAPRLSQQLFASCERGDFDGAEKLRAAFMALEDVRDALGPARVLHAAIEQAGIVRTGKVPPFVSALSEDQLRTLTPVAKQLVAANTVLDDPPGVGALARP
jgi:dihydrodipicolinate synthase/N-acetylneuraminate lyase